MLSMRGCSHQQFQLGETLWHYLNLGDSLNATDKTLVYDMKQASYEQASNTQTEQNFSQKTLSWLRSVISWNILKHGLRLHKTTELDGCPNLDFTISTNHFFKVHIQPKAHSYHTIVVSYLDSLVSCEFCFSSVDLILDQKQLHAHQWPAAYSPGHSIYHPPKVSNGSTPNGFLQNGEHTPSKSS